MFQKIKSILYKIVFLILFFVLAKTCISDYISGADETSVSHYEQMINDDSFVYANLAEQYTKTTVAKVVSSYTFDYTFELNEKKYSGKISISELPNAPVLKLYYLKSDPNIVSYDPKKSLETEKSKGQSISDLLVGILWAILAVLVLLSLLPKREKAEQIVLKTDVLEKEKTSSENLELEKMEQDTSREERENPERFMPK